MQERRLFSRINAHRGIVKMQTAMSQRLQCRSWTVLLDRDMRFSQRIFVRRNLLFSQANISIAFASPAAEQKHEQAQTFSSHQFEVLAFKSLSSSINPSSIGLSPLKFGVIVGVDFTLFVRLLFSPSRSCFRLILSPEPFRFLCICSPRS